jgi:conjugal transfer/entry exclusion protein
VSVPGGGRDQIFRTKVKDGSFNMPDVIGALHTQVRYRKAVDAVEQAKEANRDVAERIRGQYKLKNSYVSAYVGGAGSFCAPAGVEGMINVQVNFGVVSPEVAEKIMAFAKSLDV